MQSSVVHHRYLLSNLLKELEGALKALNLWQNKRPSEFALASQMPFAIDTLRFPEWLQFIFIEKMSQRLQLNAPLPSKMSITPMATEYFKSTAINSDILISVIRRIDALINETI
tara:strand:+ start:5063 stop:5404 length:342 start_codon:yes stop_codon:yes gene_type:complete